MRRTGMPFGMWSKGFANALAHPKKTVDFMFNNSEYLQARLAGNSQNEIISMLTNEADKFRALRNFCTSNTKYGDIIAIMFVRVPGVYLTSNLFPTTLFPMGLATATGSLLSVVICVIAFAVITKNRDENQHSGWGGKRKF